jgi:hypothetical protein
VKTIRFLIAAPPMMLVWIVGVTACARRADRLEDLMAKMWDDLRDFSLGTNCE